jgi:hypothetical protein
MLSSGFMPRLSDTLASHICKHQHSHFFKNMRVYGTVVWLNVEILLFRMTDIRMHVPPHFKWSLRLRYWNRLYATCCTMSHSPIMS